MAKEREVTVIDEAIQTTQGSDNSSDKTVAVGAYKKIDVNIYNHEKAYEYLEKTEEELERNNPAWLEKAYYTVEGYIEILRNSQSFADGFNKVMEAYKSDYSNNDQGNFVLIRLLEEFSERFSPNRYYTEEMHNKDFQYALSIAPEIEQSVLGAISDFEDIE